MRYFIWVKTRRCDACGREFDLIPGYLLAENVRHPQNVITGNATMDRGLEHFTEGMAEVFTRMRAALRPGHPLVFTYHHNSIEAYFPIAAALLDAGLVCSATPPCPAEMGASIHINGTGSSIVDTVFVCRSTGTVVRRLIATTPPAIAGLVRDDVELLKGADFEPTHGVSAAWRTAI